MRKAVAGLMALVFIFALVGCSKETVSSEGYEGKMRTITENLFAGKIPEVEYALGDNPDGIKKHFDDLLAGEEHSEEEENHNHSHDEVTSFTVTEGFRSVKMDAGKFVYHYEVDKKDRGVSVIVSYTEAFGFTAGETTMQEVSACFDPNSIVKFTATEDDMYFLVYPVENCMILRFEADNYKLDFYFSDNVLVAALIMEKENWTL